MSDTGSKPDPKPEVDMAAVLAESDAQRVADQGVEVWSPWEIEIQKQVDKMLDDSRLMKLSLITVGGVALMALGVGAMATKVVTQIAKGMDTLVQNQAYMAQVIGITEQSNTAVAPSQADKNTGPTAKEEAMVMSDNIVKATSPIQDPKTFDLPPDMEVAVPHEGPATEASAAAKAQMAEDKAAGIIDLAKEGGEPL